MLFRSVEVRKLAERSQQAAKEIGLLASNSVERAEKAGKLIQQVVPDIQKTASLVEEITLACQEQSSGSNQIREAVTSLDQVTQQNSATSEETAAASEELSSQSQAMQELTARFKISSNGNGGHLTLEDHSDSHIGRPESSTPRLPAPRKPAAASVSSTDEAEFTEF